MHAPEHPLRGIFCLRGANSDLSGCCDIYCRGAPCVLPAVKCFVFAETNDEFVTLPCGRTQGLTVCGARRMSSAINRLRPPPTAAPAAPLLHLPLAAQRLAPLHAFSGACQVKKFDYFRPRRSTSHNVTFSASGKFHLCLGFSSPHKGRSPLRGPHFG